LLNNQVVDEMIVEMNFYQVKFVKYPSCGCNDSGNELLPSKVC